MTRSRPRPNRRTQTLVAPPVAAALVLALFGVASIATAGTGGIGAAGAATPPPTVVGPSPSPFPTALATPPPSLQAPHVRARAAILVNLATGQVLFAKAPDARRSIASVTKIMTALLVIRDRSTSHVVTVPAGATHEQGSTLGLVAGERISVGELLYALMLQSSNDVAIALADDVAGSTAAFVARMNHQASELGLRNTHFTSPNGLDDRGYSTARNLAGLTRAALRMPGFTTVVRSKTHDIPSPTGAARHVQNRNALLWLYPGTFGVKTGFTTAAGQCLVAAARRGDRRIVAVVLGDIGDHVFDDAAALFNYGFLEFAKVPVTTAGASAGSLQVQGRPVPVDAGQSLTRLVRRDRIGEITARVMPSASLTLPLAAGQPVGRVTFLAHGVILGSVPAVAAIAVEPVPTRPPGRPVDGATLDDLLAVLLRAAFGAFL